MVFYLIFLTCFFVIATCYNFRNDLIFEYFKYKKVPSVVGFSCNLLEDVLLIRRFNKFGVTAMMPNSMDAYKINYLSFTGYNRLGIFIDLRCFNEIDTYKLFSNASRYKLFGELHHWLILGSNLSDIIAVLNDDSFGLSTDVVIAVPFINISTEPYVLYDVYNPWKDRGGKINVTFLGFWNKTEGIKVVLTDSKLNRRKNMNGFRLKAFFHWSKHRIIKMHLEEYFQHYTLNPIDGISKYGYSILKYLSEMFNFTLHINMSPIWKEGDTIGPIQQAIFNKEIDITGSPAVINKKRMNFVKFVHQSWPLRTCFMFRTPQKSEIKINEILGPFHIEVWYLLGLLIILSTFVLSLFFGYESDDVKVARHSTSFLITIGSFCQQGTDIRMTHFSTRTAFLCIMLCSLLLYNYYSASIVSVRLNEPIYKLNDSLIELTKLKFKFASEWVVYFEFIIKKPDYETQVFANKCWKSIPDSEKFMEPHKGISLVKEGGFAYHTHPDIGYPIIVRHFNNREICELTEVHLFKPALCSFAINRNSTFEEMVRVGLTKIAEVGVQYRQIKRWTVGKPTCFKNILIASGLSIYEFLPHLIILLIGMILALIIFVFEKIKWNFKELRRHESDSRDYFNDF